MPITYQYVDFIEPIKFLGDSGPATQLLEFPPLSEPVRTKPPLPVGCYPYIVGYIPLGLCPSNLTAFQQNAFQKNAFQISDCPEPDKWLIPLSQPVRTKAPLPVACYQFYTKPEFTQPPIVPPMSSWYPGLSQPVRVKPPLPVGTIPYYFPDARLFGILAPPVFPPDNFVLSDTDIEFPITAFAKSDTTVSNANFDSVMSDAAVAVIVTEFVQSQTAIRVSGISFVKSDTTVVSPGFGIFTGFAGS